MGGRPLKKLREKEHNTKPRKPRSNSCCTLFLGKERGLSGKELRGFRRECGVNH